MFVSLLLWMSFLAAQEDKILAELPAGGFIVSCQVSSPSSEASPCLFLKQESQVSLWMSASQVWIESPGRDPFPVWTLSEKTLLKRSLLLTRYDDRLRVAVDGRILGEIQGLTAQGGTLVQPAGPWEVAEDFRVQPLAPVDFSDDFMRGKESLGEWTPVSGEWTVEGMDCPELSASPFAMAGSSAQVGMAWAGQWFWNDLVFQASVRIEDPSSSVGLVLNASESEGYILVRWSGTASLEKPGQLTIFQVCGQETRVLQEKSGGLPTGRWLALEAAMAHGQLVVGVGGTVVMSLENPLLLGGQIGLYVASGRALFDDVIVKGVDVKKPLGDQVDLTDRAAAPVRDLFVKDAYMQNWAAQAQTWTPCPVPGGISFDYTFYQAPVDWAPGAGQWTIAPRWICRPDYSWMLGEGEGLVTLWHAWRFQGDQVAEAFMANSMTARMVPHYDRYPNRCLTICGDGKDPLSGYALIWGGTDFPTRLVRKRQVIAESTKLLDPMGRKDYDVVVSGLHRLWTGLRLEKKGAEVKAFVNEELFFSFVDPVPLEGGQVVLWSSKFSLTVARVRVASLNPERPQWESVSSLLPPPRGRNEVGGEEDSSHSLHINPCVGPARQDLIQEPYDLHEHPGLTFEILCQPGSARALVVQTSAGKFAGILNGPGPLPPTFMPLSVPNIPDDGQWHRVRVDVQSAVSSHRPEVSQCQVTQVSVEDLSGETMILPDTGLAPIGAWQGVKGFSLSARRAKSQTVDAPLPVQLKLSPDPRLCWEDFDTKIHGFRTYGGEDGALPVVQTDSSAVSGQYLRAINQRVGGCFGLYAWTQPYDLGKYPLIAFDVRMDKEVFIHLLVKVAGQWEEISLSGKSHDRPPIGEAPVPVNTGQWERVILNVFKAFMASKKPCKTPVVEAVAFAETGYYSHVSGVHYDIDNFEILSHVPVDQPVILEIKEAQDDSEQVQVEIVPAGSGQATPLEPGPDGRFRIQGLAPGSYEVRAQTKAPDGTLGPVAKTCLSLREKLEDKVSPVIGSLVPAPETRAGDKEIRFTLTDEGFGVDASSVRLEVDGQGYDLFSETLSVDVCPGQWTWDGNRWGTSVGEGPVKCRISCSDLVGNSSQMEWTWEFSPSLDQTPPSLSHVTTIPVPFLRWWQFQEGPEGWKAFNMSIVDWGSNPGPWDDGAVTLRQLWIAERAGGISIDGPAFSASEWPIFSFDGLRLEGDPDMVLICRVHNTDYEIPVRRSLRKGQWGRATVDIEKGLRKLKLEEENPQVTFMVLSFVKTGTLVVDNACLSARNVKESLVRWAEPEDASGVSTYRWTVDVDPAAEALSGEETHVPALTIPLQANAPAYLHLQALDSAGNWSQPLNVFLKPGR